MSVVEGPRSAGLVARAQAILLRPKAEWDVIDTETATTQGLFTGYACILAAIPPVVMILSHLLFIHWGIVPLIVIAAVSYAASLAGAFIIGFIIDALAPSFDGQKNQVQAMKLAVYSYTAVWVAGIFYIVPILGTLGFIAGGLYSLYILYIGLPKLMKSPPEKTAGYFVVTLIAGFIINAIIFWIVAMITFSLMLGAVVTGATAFSSAAVHNGNFAALSAASRQMAAASQQMAASAQGGAAAAGQANGKAVVAVDPATLKGFLPDTVAGMPRTDVSAQSVGAAGMNSSKAEAVYTKGASRITVSVTDMAAMGALTRVVGAMGVQSSEQTATGYEKTATVNGRLTTEKWNTANKSGEYMVVVAGRFAVSAEGNTGSIDDLKAAVSAVGPDRLEGLAKA